MQVHIQTITKDAIREQPFLRRQETQGDRLTLRHNRSHKQTIGRERNQTQTINPAFTFWVCPFLRSPSCGSTSGRLQSRWRRRSARSCSRRGAAVSPSASCLLRLSLLELMASPLSCSRRQTAPAACKTHTTLTSAHRQLNSLGFPRCYSKSTKYSTLFSVGFDKQILPLYATGKFYCDVRFFFWSSVATRTQFGDAPRTSVQLVPSCSSELTVKKHREKVVEVHLTRTLSRRWRRRTLTSVGMIVLTIIARVSDGLPLSASVQEDEEVWMRVSFPS